MIVDTVSVPLIIYSRLLVDMTISESSLQHRAGLIPYLVSPGRRGVLYIRPPCINDICCAVLSK